MDSQRFKSLVSQLCYNSYTMGRAYSDPSITVDIEMARRAESEAFNALMNFWNTLDSVPGPEPTEAALHEVLYRLSDIYDMLRRRFGLNIHELTDTLNCVSDFLTGTTRSGAVEEPPQPSPQGTDTAQALKDTIREWAKNAADDIGRYESHSYHFGFHDFAYHLRHLEKELTNA